MDNVDIMAQSWRPDQRRRAMLLVLLLAASLWALLLLASNGSRPPQSAGAGSLREPTEVPSRAPRTPTPWPSTNYTTQQWWVTGGATPGSGRAAEPSATPTAYFIYFPQFFHYVEPRVRPTKPAPEPPAPPPTPEWPPGLTRQTNSKLGLHVLSPNDSFIMEFIRRVRPRVVKAVDDLGWLSDVKAVSPNTITLGRINEQNEDWVQTKDPAQAAEEYVASQIERYRLNPGVDYWEGWNEFVPVDNARLAWYAQFEARRVCYLQQLGFRGAVGGFSVGVPEYEQMAVFLPALEAAYRCGGIFTLHEYNSPTMACGTGTAQASHIPGAPLIEDTAVGYHALRYRFWYEGLLKPGGMGDLPLVISEAGIEGRPTPGGPCNDPGGRAWKSYQEYWIAQGYGPTGPEAYVNVLSWYDQQLRQDPYVIGATLFTAGAPNSGDTWFPFDLHEVLVPLAYYAVNLK